MDPVAALNRRVLFPAWVLKNRSTRLQYVRQFEATQFLSRDELQALRWRQFRQLLDHANARCPFYRRKFAAIGLEPGDIGDADAVRHLPMTTKQEIQEFQDELIADDADRSRLVRDMTGGSTGAPMVFFYDRDRLDSRAAATIRHNRWTGWDIGEKMAVLWGAARDVGTAPSLKIRVRDWIIDRRVLLDASAIDDARMERFLAELRRSRARFVLGYANTLALFARFLRARGLPPPPSKAVISSAELLTSEDRRVIEDTFGCRVFNRYGSREFAVIASECEAHDGMHINAESLWIETERLESAGAPEIVVTDLRNFDMPLIRYRTMDSGHLRDSYCPCGRTLPLLDLAGGRVTDFLQRRDGTRVSGIVLATYAITNLPGVAQIQFVQTAPESVTVKVVRGLEWRETTAEGLLQRVREYLGHDMPIELAFVNEIPREASGKFRFSISALG